MLLVIVNARGRRNVRWERRGAPELLEAPSARGPRRLSRTPPVALAFVRTVIRPPNLLVFSTPEIEARAVEDWLQRSDDQDFSLCDAVSFAVMRERRIADALSLDRHFRTAGLRVMP